MFAPVAVLQTLVVLALSSAGNPPAPSPAPHREQNALFRQLLAGGQSGVPPLPEPSLDDGLDAEGQRAVVASLPGLRVRPAEFLRDSSVAPIHLRVGREPAHKDGPRQRSVDLWFAASGDLDAIVAGGRAFDLFPRDDGPQDLIPTDQLARRGIKPPGPNTSFAHATFAVLERVQLRVTLRTEWSRTADSIVVAGAIDPRFAGDRDYPNAWSPIVAGPDGVDRIGVASPYSVYVFYLKMTRLAAPAGMLLLEYHARFEHPPGWFNGHDLLTSKLPIAVESGVRSFRRRLARSGRPGSRRRETPAIPKPPGIPRDRPRAAPLPP